MPAGSFPWMHPTTSTVCEPNGLPVRTATMGRPRTDRPRSTLCRAAGGNEWTCPARGSVSAPDGRAFPCEDSRSSAATLVPTATARIKRTVPARARVDRFTPASCRLLGRNAWRRTRAFSVQGAWCGTHTSTVVPAPGELRISQRPPRISARSRIPCNPRWAATSSSFSWSNPDPSSSTRSR